MSYRAWTMVIGFMPFVGFGVYLLISKISTAYFGLTQRAAMGYAIILAQLVMLGFVVLASLAPFDFFWDYQRYPNDAEWFMGDMLFIFAIAMGIALGIGLAFHLYLEEVKE